MKTSESGGITRRNFLRGAAATVGGIAAGEVARKTGISPESAKAKEGETRWFDIPVQVYIIKDGEKRYINGVDVEVYWAEGNLTFDKEGKYQLPKNFHKIKDEDGNGVVSQTAKSERPVMQEGNMQTKQVEQPGMANLRFKDKEIEGERTYMVLARYKDSEGKELWGRNVKKGNHSDLFRSDNKDSSIWDIELKEKKVILAEFASHESEISGLPEFEEQRIDLTKLRLGEAEEPMTAI